jgi:hypothetical protein
MVVDHHVARLDVAVQEPFGVHLHQPLQDLCEDPLRPPLAQGPADTQHFV